MAMSVSRRVQTVRLRSASDTLIRQGAILLEDALHTASLPGIDDGRLLIIRSLNLGKINTRQSSAGLALTVEKCLWQLSATAVYAEDPTANKASAVYFRDDAEPYICLAKRLIQQGSTDEWFWKLAIPKWQADLPRQEALRLLLVEVIHTRSGVAAVAALIEELHHLNGVNQLLSSLRSPDGSQLLYESGWFQPDLPAVLLALPSTQQPVLSNSWRNLLHCWLSNWGERDSRSLWLAVIALIAEKPARLLDPNLIQQAQQLVAQLISARVFPIIPLTTTATPVAQTTREISPPEQIAKAQLDISSSGLSTSPSFITPTALTPQIPDVADSQQEIAPVSLKEQGSEIPQYTEYAGLFFLICLLNHLGMTEFLVSHPHFIEVDLPQRLLYTIAQRLLIPEDDPVRMALTGVDLTTELSDCNFVAPANWQQSVWQSVTCIMRPVADTQNTKILFDASGRLAVAIWQGKFSHQMRNLIGENSLNQGNVIKISTFIDVIIQSWIIAIRRWCRTYAGMGLHNLVRRPGRILISRTHLDVLFNLKQADIRIRRVGLDLNPGWVLWFGRVVAFHYQDREENHGS